MITEFDKITTKALTQYIPMTCLIKNERIVITKDYDFSDTKPYI